MRVALRRVGHDRVSRCLFLNIFIISNQRMLSSPAARQMMISMG
jgi:hypothetical protein